MEKFKVLLVAPAAFAGVTTALAFHYPPKTLAELELMLAIILPLYLVNLAVIAWMWTKPPGERHLDLTRGTWAFLLAGAYLAGLIMMLIA
jgi:hypothetical protein